MIGKIDKMNRGILNPEFRNGHFIRNRINVKASTRFPRVSDLHVKLVNIRVDPEDRS